MDKFDIIIIGSGLGGLQCAYTLSQEGYNVCVLEKNRQLGGCLQIFSRDKAILDTGVHYIGGLDEGQNLNRYFKYYGIMDDLKLRKLDQEAFDVISFHDDPKEYNLAQSYALFENSLIADFPKEKEAILSYTSKLKEIAQKFPLYNLEPNGNDFQYEMNYLTENTKQYLTSLTDNRKLANILAGNNALYAGDSEKTPLYMHALITNSYIESSYKCVDGGKQIEQGLTKGIKSQGGTVKNYSEVTEIIVEDGLAKGVKLKTGEVLQAKQFISNLHPKQTLSLLKPQDAIRKSFRNRISKLKNTPSVFIVYLIFKPNSFPYQNRNYYHHMDDDVWSGIHYSESSWPHNFALFFSASSKSQDYAESASLMTYMNYEEVQEWESSFHTIPNHRTERNNSYQEFKEKKAEKLLIKLEERMPGIRSKIMSYHTSSPLTFRDYIGTDDGSAYGVTRDCNFPLHSFFAPQSKVKNLYFTGQNINMHGILGVTIGSVITCSAFLGNEYLINKIKSCS